MRESGKVPALPDVSNFVIVATTGANTHIGIEKA